MTVIKTPFTISPSGKVAVEKVTEKIVVQKIKDYIFTRQFERPMTPLYGANVQDLVFENFDELVFQEFKTETVREINKHIAEADVVGMAIRPANPNSLFTSEDGAINIEVNYRMPLGGIKTAAFSLVSPPYLTEDSRI